MMPRQVICCWFLFFMAYAVQNISGAANTTLSCTRRGQLTKPHEIVCQISGQITSGITWKRPDGVRVSRCTTSHLCTSNPGYRVTVINANRYILRINNVYITDAGDWTCSDGPNGSVIKACDLSVDNEATCSINKTATIIFVDFTQYFCSADVKFHLESSNGKRCDVSLISVSGNFLTHSRGLCEITREWSGKVFAFMMCEDVTNLLACTLSLGSDDSIGSDGSDGSDVPSEEMSGAEIAMMTIGVVVMAVMIIFYNYIAWKRNWIPYRS